MRGLRRALACGIGLRRRGSRGSAGGLASDLELGGFGELNVGLPGADCAQVGVGGRHRAVQVRIFNQLVSCDVHHRARKDSPRMYNRG